MLFSISPKYNRDMFAGLANLDIVAQHTPFVVETGDGYTPFVKRTEKGDRVLHDVRITVPRFSDLRTFQRGMTVSVFGHPQLTKVYSRAAGKHIPTLEFVVKGTSVTYAAPKDYAFVEP